MNEDFFEKHLKRITSAPIPTTKFGQNTLFSAIAVGGIPGQFPKLASPGISPVFGVEFVHGHASISY